MSFNDLRECSTMPNGFKEFVLLVSTFSVCSESSNFMLFGTSLSSRKECRNRGGHCCTRWMFAVVITFSSRNMYCRSASARGIFPL